MRSTYKFSDILSQRIQPGLSIDHRSDQRLSCGPAVLPFGHFRKAQSKVYASEYRKRVSGENIPVSLVGPKNAAARISLQSH